MNRLLRVCLCYTTIGWALSSYALSGAKNTSYEFIAGRNVFKLQLPVPAVSSPVKPASNKPTPKVVVTGLTDVCGRKQALIEISEPGEPTIKPVLAEGEEAGLVQLLHIDVGRSLVNVRIHGQTSTLALSSLSVRTASPPVHP